MLVFAPSGSHSPAFCGDQSQFCHLLEKSFLQLPPIQSSSFLLTYNINQKM
jgi:hypothetical protein